MSNADVNFNLIIMQPSVDALQEFKVQSGVYPAQFGREEAPINAATKSGKNQFHCSLFEFIRNDVLDDEQSDFIKRVLRGHYSNGTNIVLQLAARSELPKFSRVEERTLVLRVQPTLHS